jgi:hypothetical protein
VIFAQSHSTYLPSVGPVTTKLPLSTMSSSTIPFEPSRLMHSSYDLASDSPQVSIKLQNTVSDFMDVVRKKQASVNQINDFIAFVDDD